MSMIDTIDNDARAKVAQLEDSSRFLVRVELRRLKRERARAQQQRQNGKVHRLTADINQLGAEIDGQRRLIRTLRESLLNG